MSVILDKLLKGQKVEWFPLAEIAEIGTGSRNTNEAKENGKYDFYVRSQKPLKIDEYEFDELAILTAGDGVGVGRVFHYVDGKYALHQRAYRIKVLGKNVNTKFLFYIFKSNFSEYLRNISVHASVTSLRKPMFEKYLVPVPPFDVQIKIVKILDEFTALTTELTAELTAELTMREKQYHYYRDKLLTFPDDEVESKALSDVVLPTKNIKWKETNLSYKYIDLSSVDRGNNNIGETLEITSKNAPSRAQKIVKQDDIIFATTRPTQMRVAIIPKNFDEQIASTGYCILRANQKEILPKWIYYNLSLDRFKFYLEENQSGVAYPAISDGMVKEFQIPIPSLKEQKRIIKILDKFEILNHSITEVLPKEIALRQKQYEYYREQLLDFPKQYKDN